MTKRSRKVLMLLGSYDPGAHRGIARAARECGWFLDVSLLKTFQLDAGWSGDGIICSLNQNRRLADFVTGSGLPVVDLSVWRSDLELPRVAADNTAIGRAAAEHLLAFGHRTFVWFALSRNPVGEARRAAFGARLAAAGLRVARLDGAVSRRREAVAGRLAALPRPCAVFCKSDDDAAWIESVCLEAGLRIPQEVAILGVDNNALICDNQPVPLSSVNHDLERIGYEGARLLDRIMRDRRHGRPGMRLVAPAGVTTRASTDALAVADERVRRALYFIEANLRRPIGTADVAAAVGLARRSLEQRFAACLGAGVHARLLDLRLARAERLLRDGGDSVEAIAAECGFANAPHLSRTFKARYGQPPLRYRKALQVAMSG